MGGGGGIVTTNPKKDFVYEKRQYKVLIIQKKIFECKLIWEEK